METPTCLQRGDVAPPQIFISSTFEDGLGEIRDLLRAELEDFNYLPLMSELGTFRYTHGKSAIYDDTINTVATSQFYILIIGRRYGTAHPQTGLSITELEYLAARKAGLPILVYVEASVWDGHRAFRARAIGEGKYTHWVDDERVFDFIDRVAYQDACRCVPFSYAREIITDFKCQLANLLGGYLRFEVRAAPWLWTESRTRRVESMARVIWVLTPNFYWDYADPEFRDLVFENVTMRGAHYYYLYRSCLENDRRIAEMTRDYSAAMGDAWREAVHYAAIPEAEFNWCTEQALFNPGDPANERGVLVDIMEGRGKAGKHNIELGREKLGELRGQFERLWQRYGAGDPFDRERDVETTSRQ